MMRHILDLGLQDADVHRRAAPRASPLSRRRWPASTWRPKPPSAGVDADLLRAAAVAFGQAGAAAIIVRTRADPGRAGREADAAPLADLALLTGNVGRPGTGLYPRAQRRELAGPARTWACVPTGCPAGLRGRRGTRAKLEAAWGADLAALPPGVALADLVPAIEAGDHQGPVRGRRRSGAGPGRRRADRARRWPSWTSWWCRTASPPTPPP